MSPLIQLDKPGSMDTICERCEDSDEDFEQKIDNNRYLMSGPPPGMMQQPQPMMQHPHPQQQMPPPPNYNYPYVYAYA